MPITSFKSLLWGRGESVTSEKLNQMVNNSQYLFEQMPKTYYNTYGIKKTSGLKILAGIISIAPSNALWTSGRVEFGSYFTPGCKPVVVTGHQPTAAKWRYHTIVKGIGTYYPDHRGIELHVGADYYGTSTKNVVMERQYVHYIVLGW